MVDKANNTLQIIDLWMRAYELDVAPEKTEIVPFACMKKLRNSSFKLKDVVIEPSKVG